MITVGSPHGRCRVAYANAKCGKTENGVRFPGFPSWKYRKVQRAIREVDKGLGFHWAVAEWVNAKQNF